MSGALSCPSCTRKNKTHDVCQSTRSQLNTILWTVRGTVTRKAMATVCLMVATFLNPFGFDILVYKLTQLTNDYWSTMYVLYSLAFLSFSLSYLFFKTGKRKIGNLLITLALFLNPLGYDLVVYGIMLLTKSYWLTMTIMYAMTTFFFGLFAYFENIQLIRHVKYHTKNTHRKIKTKFSKNG